MSIFLPNPFQGPFEQGAEATVKFTNFSNLPGTIQFTLIDGKGLASLGLLHQIFHLKGPNIVTDSRAVRSTTDSNTTATIVSGYPVYPVPVFFPFRSSCFTYLNVTMHPPDLALVRLKPITPAEERMGPLPQSFTICFWTGPVRGWTSAVQDWTTLVRDYQRTVHLLTYRAGSHFSVEFHTSDTLYG